MKITRLFSLLAPISMAGMVCLLVFPAITLVLASQSLAGQQHHNAHLAQYKTQEEVKTRQILIAVKPGANAATDAAARAKAQDVLNQLRAGASFAVLAMKYSDDLGSKDQGGELGWVPASLLVPAYANAAMALKPGQTSGLVRSTFGYHIIQLEKKQSAGERLTLSQVEQLVTHGVPDSTLSSQIRVHGLIFTPTPAILDSLHAKGAGPSTLEAIQEAALNSDVSKPDSSGARGPENGSPASGSWRQLSMIGGQADLLRGVASGIRWVRLPGGQGAVFSAANSSRIEYPDLIPSEGTLEFLIKVNHGYHYDNYQFKDDQDDAMIFSSDVQGGDVTWPGDTKLFVKANGDISYWMAIAKYDQPRATATEAHGTGFRFGEWHVIGVSYGDQGQYIMLDGQIVAASPFLTQTFGRAGNHQEPLDVPTIGETVSHFWDHHRYEGGFDGTLGGFRISNRQKDWSLALDRNPGDGNPGTHGWSEPLK